MVRARRSERERQNIVQSQQEIGTDLHRVILFGSSGAELLVLHDRGRLNLPTAPIPRHQRIAERLTAFARREWFQEAVSLFRLGSSPTDSETHYQVMESTATQRSTPAGF